MPISVRYSANNWPSTKTFMPWSVFSIANVSACEGETLVASQPATASVQTMVQWVRFMVAISQAGATAGAGTKR